MVGGLLAVVVTESIQAVLLMTGAICITVIGLYHVGGWSGLVANTEPIKMAMLRPTGDPSNLPWYSVILGYPVIGIWYWCTIRRSFSTSSSTKTRTTPRVGHPLYRLRQDHRRLHFRAPRPDLLCMVRQGRLSGLTDSADTYAFMIGRLGSCGR